MFGSNGREFRVIGERRMKALLWFVIGWVAANLFQWAANYYEDNKEKLDAWVLSLRWRK